MRNVFITTLAAVFALGIGTLQATTAVVTSTQAGVQLSGGTASFPPIEPLEITRPGNEPVPKATAAGDPLVGAEAAADAGVAAVLP